MLYPPNQPFYHHLGISNSFSTGVLRKIGFVLLIVALVALTARKSWIEPQRGRISRPSRYGRDASVVCPSDRPFICDALDELGQEYPPWLKKDGGAEDFAKCAPCNTAARKPCADPFNFAIQQDGRLEDRRCSPKLCKREQTATTDCIAPVKIDKKLRWKRSDRRSRQKRQGTPLPSVIYPRCIKTDGLPEDQKAIVEADELLDCAKNPFYKQFGIMALTVSNLPLCGQVDQNQKFCVVTRQTAAPTLPPTTVAPEEPEQLGLFLGIGAAVLIAVLVVVGVIYLLKSGGRKKAEEEPAADPKSESSDNSQAATPSQSEPTAA
ncbi:unnamed protein product, partial [Mesorhabditis spiculigera]